MRYKIDHLAYESMPEMVREIAHAPTLALEDPRFRDPENVEAFLRAGDDWTYNNSRIVSCLAETGRRLVDRLEAPSLILRAYADYLKCDLLKQQGSLLEMREVYRRLEREFESSHEIQPLEVANLWRRIGRCESSIAYFEQGDPHLHWAQSDDYHYRSWRLAQLRDNHFEGRTYASWAVSRGSRAEYENSLKHFQSAEELFELALARLDPEKGPVAVSHALQGLDTVHLFTGITDVARAHRCVKRISFSPTTRKRGEDRAKKGAGLRVDPPDSGSEISVRGCLVQTRYLVKEKRYALAATRYGEIAEAFDELGLRLEARKAELEQAYILALAERPYEKTLEATFLRLKSLGGDSAKLAGEALDKLGIPVKPRERFEALAALISPFFPSSHCPAVVYTAI